MPQELAEHLNHPDDFYHHSSYHDGFPTPLAVDGRYFRRSGRDFDCSAPSNRTVTSPPKERI
jgi:hypothetical protein